MSELKQIRPALAAENALYKEDRDLVYVYVFLDSRAGTDVIDSYAQEVTDRDEENHLAVAWVEVCQLEKLAEIEAVRAVRTVMPPVIETGSVNTEGDVVHRADQVRSLYGQYGSGIKIGVISDGVDHWTNARDSGDLPANLTVLSNSQGGDEGTAILEIVYDLAPGAQLYFHDYGTNELAFNSAIDDLVSAGCKVIIDDIAWILEPFFEDGVIAQHVSEVISNEIVYVSSAGNWVKRHYQGEYYSYAGGWHDFSHGTDPLFKTLRINIPANGQFRIVMQWNDKFGASANDYGLYLWEYGTDNLLAYSDEDQNGNDDPLEGLICYNNGSTAVDIEITAFRNWGSSKTLEVFVYPDAATLYSDNLTEGDSIFGHPAVPGAIAVGAIDYPNNDLIAYYSSHGPVTISYPSSELRSKPDVCGMSGVEVTGAGDFPSSFFGTSAAAPHVAAIAALTWAQYPGKTAAEIRNIVTSEAVDLGDSGFDNIYGNGRADALNSVQPPVVVSTDPIDNTTCVPVNQVITLNFNEPVLLGDNAGGIALRKGDSVIAETYNVSNNVLTIVPSNLDHRTNYTVYVPAGSVTDLAGKALANDYTFGFTTEPIRGSIILALTTPPVPADGDRYQLGSVRISTIAGSVYSGAAGEMDLYLPDGFEFDWDTLQTDANGIIEAVYNLISPVDGGCFEDNGFDGAVFKAKRLSNNGIKIWLDQVTDRGLLESNDGCIFITLNNILVPVGASGDITLSLSAPCTSGFPNASVVVGRCVVGQVSVSVPEIHTFSNEVNVYMRFHENSPKAFKTSTESLKLRLPSGFEWKSIGIPYIEAGDNTWLEKVNFRIDERDLFIDTVTNAAYQTERRTMFTVTATIKIADINEAEYGNVVASIGGLTPATPQELIIARYVDKTPPTVVVTDPLPWTTDVPVDSLVAITFSEPVVLGDNVSGIKLQKGDTVVTITYGVNNNVLTIDPVGNLDYSVSYTVYIPAGAVKDLAGNALTNGYGFGFATASPPSPGGGGGGGGGGGAVVDTTPPVVTGTQPADGATGIPVDTSITLTFSEEIKEGSAYNNISVKDDKGKTVNLSRKIDVKTLILKPDTRLGFGTKYTVTVPAGAVKDTKGNDLAKDFTLSFTTEKAQVKPAPVPVGFSDMSGHWAAESVSRLAGMDIFGGYPDGTFEPDKNITRAEVTAILVRVLNLAPGDEDYLMFGDSDKIAAWVRSAVAAAVYDGLVKGYPQPDGSINFEPERLVSRAELAAMLARVIEKKLGAVTPAALDFADTAQIPVWAERAVGVAYGKGVIGGYPDNTFRPQNTATRAETASMVERLIDLIK
ncbi:MAG: Ig-like domain-containing protein [Bacillota bacterium]